MNHRQLTRRGFWGTAAIASRAFAAPAQPPSPYGALPSARQVAWHELEFYGFLHFTVNTFTDKEWGYGDEDPNLFNPTAFDANAIASALKESGMKGFILTCKHHDGFCLWPTKTTKHSVAASSWRGGKGDVVRDLSEAARRHGLKFGVYLSPWDRNHPAYGKPAYIDVYRAQLRELLTGYGPIFEVWHDGANGGDGYYGGAREKRLIDKKSYYDWPKTWDLVRRLQPGAVIFSDVGPDVRWVGNEKGIANETCWATYNPVGEQGDAAAPGYTRYKEGGTGHRNASHWLPAECDVSIRPGWFWHEKENARVKTPRQLMDLYYHSVGRGASFLLNVPPDRRGLLHEADVASLRGFGRMLRETFAESFAAQAKTKVTASNVRGGDPKAFGPANLLDAGRYTYWSCDEGTNTPDVVFDFGRHLTFNVVRLRENIRLGQRVEAVVLEQEKAGGWEPFAEATSIGASRIIRTKEMITAARLRLRVAKSPVVPALSEFGLYMEAGEA